MPCRLSAASTCGIYLRLWIIISKNPSSISSVSLLPVPESNFHLELQNLMILMHKQFHGSFFLKKWRWILIRHDRTRVIYCLFFLQWWSCFKYVWTHDFVRDLICIFLSRRMSLLEFSSSCLRACEEVHLLIQVSCDEVWGFLKDDFWQLVADDVSFGLKRQDARMNNSFLAMWT